MYRDIPRWIDIKTYLKLTTLKSWSEKKARYELVCLLDMQVEPVIDLHKKG